MPDRIQHPIAIALRISHDQRLLDQADHQVQNVVLRDLLSRADGFGGSARPATGESCQPGEQPLLHVVEQVIAPVDGGPERLVPRQHVAAAAGQQAKALIEQRHDLVDRQHRDARCSQFQRQRNAVEPHANLGHRSGALLLQVEVCPVLTDALDEQPHSIGPGDSLRTAMWIGQRQRA